MGTVIPFPVVPRPLPDNRASLITAGAELRAHLALFAERALKHNETEFAIRKIETECEQIIQFLIQVTHGQHP